MLENLKIISMSDIKIWNSYLQGREEKHSGRIIYIVKKPSEVWTIGNIEIMLCEI